MWLEVLCQLKNQLPHRKLTPNVYSFFFWFHSNLRCCVELCEGSTAFLFTLMPVGQYEHHYVSRPRNSCWQGSTGFGNFWFLIITFNNYYAIEDVCGALNRSAEYVMLLASRKSIVDILKSSASHCRSIVWEWKCYWKTQLKNYTSVIPCATLLYNNGFNHWKSKRMDLYEYFRISVYGRMVCLVNSSKNL